MWPKYTYAHNHECSHKGEEVVIYSEVLGEVEFVKHPHCIEANVDLELVSREV